VPTLPPSLRTSAATPSRIGMRIRLRFAILLVSMLTLMAAPLAFAGKPPRSAPSFRLPTSRGSVALDSLRGKVVLVDFWASWCAPCARSFPWMSALHDSLAPRGFEVVAINLDKDREAAAEFLTRHPASFTVAFDPEGKTAEAYQVTAMPSSFVIDRGGSIVLSHRGFDLKKTADIEALIRKECAR
jgi:cytochrome c biogenesis protein CcmG, thiol:disulfide interchange protein DsbE